MNWNQHNTPADNHWISKSTKYFTILSICWLFEFSQIKPVIFSKKSVKGTSYWTSSALQARHQFLKIH